QLFLENYSDYELNGFGRMAVISKETDAFLGFCGLKRHPDDFVDLGFRFFRKYWDKGYATESSKAIIKHGFNELNLEEIIGRVSNQNMASIRVLRKVGMEFWKYDECQGIKDAAIYRIS